MGTLRKTIEEDLSITLEGDYGLPIILTAPDGSSQTVQGQVHYNTLQFDAQSGVDIIIEKPWVAVRRSTLTRIPVAGQRWLIQIPSTPDPDADTDSYLWDGVAPEGGRSIGFMRLYLNLMEDDGV